MKKLLIILMVVAMASFLFVGCLGVTPPVPDEDEEEPVPLPVSEAPYITDINGIDLFSTDTEYINGDEVDDVTVSGVGETGSVIRIYINGVLVGMGSTELTGTFEEIAISEDALDKEGEKTLYATATEIGLAESVPSTSYKFTYDKTTPTIASSVGEAGIAGAGYIEVTFSEAVTSDSVTDDATWNGDVNVGGAAAVLIAAPAVVVSDTVVRIYDLTQPFTQGNIYNIECDNKITDLAGNISDALSSYGELE